MRARLRHLSPWPLLSLPGIAWLALFFLAPLYVVLAIVFGGLDPVFRSPNRSGIPCTGRPGN